MLWTMQARAEKERNLLSPRDSWLLRMAMVLIAAPAHSMRARLELAGARVNE